MAATRPRVAEPAISATSAVIGRASTRTTERKTSLRSSYVARDEDGSSPSFVDAGDLGDSSSTSSSSNIARGRRFRARRQLSGSPAESLRRRRAEAVSTAYDLGLAASARTETAWRPIALVAEAVTISPNDHSCGLLVGLAVAEPLAGLLPDVLLTVIPRGAAHNRMFGERAGLRSCSRS
jgi:hypothetical protein